MGILLSCQNLAKGYESRPLFTSLSFGLFEGERTGLIGPNGAGKSTLLKILAGLETQDSGTLAARRGLRVGYLAQRDFFEDGHASSVRAALSKTLEGLDLYDYEVDMRVDAGLEAAGLSPEKKVAELSGGGRKRLAILSQVIREPDLLLLDEPTNHLDLEGVLWLERFLSGLRFSFLAVTHDRRFLERVCNRVIELNKRYADGHFSNTGHYTDFLEKREELRNNQEARADSVRNIVRGEIEWLRRGPKARGVKQQARVDRAGELMGELKELDFRNTQDRATDIDFSGSRRRTKKLVQAEKAHKSMGGRTLFGPLDLILSPGDKLGLLGENGSGKTTLLKLLAGGSKPDSGVLTQAEGLKVVTFDQHREQLDLGLTLRKALCENGEHVHYGGSPIHVAGWADRFLFRKEQLDKPLSMLSGGEQSRVLIARLMLRPADLLLLDEPTNDLDIQSLEVLEAGMMDFPGALVLVTHDRYLLDRVSKEILALDGRGGARFFAELSQWESWRGEQAKGALPDAEEAGAGPTLSTKELKELKNMEAKIRAAEELIAQSRLALEDPAVASDADELRVRQATLDAARTKVESLFKRWEELEARR